MAKSSTFQCSLITPERVVLDCVASFVAFPAHDGEMGVLVDRAPLVCKLGIGPLRVETGGKRHVFFIDGGFAQVVNNRLTILTQQAIPAANIDRAAAQKALTDAQAMKVSDEAAFQARQNAMARAKTQLQIRISAINP